MHATLSGKLLFSEAAQLWLESRKIYIGVGQQRNYLHYIKWLNKFFSALKLKDIHIGHVREFQRMRQAGLIEGGQKCGASRINHEVGCLTQVLDEAKLWKKLKDYYEPLRLPRTGPGIALSQDEARHMLKVARSKPRWAVAMNAAIITAHTTAGPGEIRHLTLKDIDVSTRHIFVHSGVKNDFRVREIPLNQPAYIAMLALIERARKMGATEPAHYLLPHRAAVKGALPDPLAPMGSWKKAHYAMRKEAAKKYPRLATMRRYDWRHTAITWMLENPEIPEFMVEEFCGHRVATTKKRYAHLHREARRRAADAIASDFEREPLVMRKMPVSVQQFDGDKIIENKA